MTFYETKAKTILSKKSNENNAEIKIFHVSKQGFVVRSVFYDIVLLPLENKETRPIRIARAYGLNNKSTILNEFQLYSTKLLIFADSSREIFSTKILKELVMKIKENPQVVRVFLHLTFAFYKFLTIIRRLFLYFEKSYFFLSYGHDRSKNTAAEEK